MGISDQPFEKVRVDGCLIRPEPVTPYTWREAENFCQALQWKKIADQLILHKPRERFKLGTFWHIQFPMSGINGYPLVRLFPGFIEHVDCPIDHRMAVVDIIGNRTYRDQQTRLDMICEEVCDCFYDGDQDHESTVSFWLL